VLLLACLWFTVHSSSSSLIITCSECPDLNSCSRTPGLVQAQLVHLQVMLDMILEWLSYLLLSLHREPLVCYRVWGFGGFRIRVLKITCATVSSASQPQWEWMPSVTFRCCDFREELLLQLLPCDWRFQVEYAQITGVLDVLAMRVRERRCPTNVPLGGISFTMGMLYMRFPVPEAGEVPQALRANDPSRNVMPLRDVLPVTNRQ
jgi:hypothetical protein